MHVSKIASAAALALSVSAFAASRDPFVNSAALIAPNSEIETATALSTGFEAPFVPGSIGGQQGWTVSTVSAVPITTANISTATPQAGAQHVRLTDFGANGTVVGAFSPNLPQPANDASQTNVSVMITNSGGADYRVQAQSPTQAFLTWRVDFDFQGDINVVDFNTAGTLALIDTGLNWTPGQYFDLGVTFEPGGPVGTPATAPAGRITYTLNGVPFYTADTLVAGTAVDQMLFLNDSFQLLNESGNFDNLSITAVPEPTALAALGLAGVMAFRRRRA